MKTGPLPLALAICADCGGTGLMYQMRCYLPVGSNRTRSRLVLAPCRSCRGRRRYPATEATGGTP